MPPKTDVEVVDVPEGAPALPAAFGIVGSRGSGKSFVTAQLLKSYMEYGSLNVLFVISPTFESNAGLWTWAGVKRENAYVRLEEAELALKHIIGKIKAQKDAWHLRQDWTIAMARHNLGKVLTIKQRALLEGPMPPDIPLPKAAVVFDDLQGSKFMNSSYVQNVVLRNRHILSNPRCGLTVLYLVQSLRQGIARPLRSNMSCWICFGTQDESVVNDIYTELSGHIKRDQFIEMFHRFTSERNSYLVVDTSAKDKSRVFRNHL